MKNILSVRSAWIVLGAGWAWTAASLTLSAQDQSPRRVGEIVFEGASKDGERIARDQVGLTIGSVLEPDTLDQAVARLLGSGRFLDVRYRVEGPANRTRVVFTLTERPTVKAIRFEGNTRFREGDLRARVPQKVGAPIDRFSIEEGRDAIEAMYRDGGYANVSVTFDRDRLEQTGTLVYRVTEGDRLRIRRVRFEGNRSFGDRLLRGIVSSKRSLWIIRSGALDEEQAQADRIRLRSFYREHGFLDAQAQPYRLDPLKPGQVALVFPIEEGTRYAIESIDFRGHTVFTREQLLTMMSSHVGETVRRSRVDADVTAIRMRYGEIGYIDADVRAVQVFSSTPGLVRITIEISEGEAFRVGRVMVRGNTRTRDKVVRRALNLYPPDDLINLTEVQEARRRLLNTRIFDTARIYPVGDQPGVRDIVMDVDEAEKAGDFIFGAGITSNSGLVGNVVIDLKNFDWSDKPRSWSELLKLRSFFGGGQRFRIELQPGTRLSRFRLDFTEPYLFDKPLRFDFSAFLFSRSRDDYDERRTGASVSFGKRFERGRFRGWSGELAFRVEDVEVRDVDLFAAKEIHEDEGSDLLTSIKGSLVRDRTDSRLVPTSGDRLRVAYEQFGALGGDIYGKLTAGYTWFKTIDVDARQRKKTLQLRAEGGTILGDAPIYNRFYGGGTGSIRGFEFRGVGERNGLNDSNIGGDYMILAGAEYSFPLMGDKVRGLFFLDTGVVGSGPLRAAIGVGARLTLDLLGPVPLEFTIAAPISSDEDDDTQGFSFQVGTIF